MSAANSPGTCPKCKSRTIPIAWKCVVFSPEDVGKPEVESGELLLGNRVDRDRTVPNRVCLASQPQWSEVHELAVRDCRLQIVKFESIEAQDFNKARQMRDLQFDFRPRLNALVDELLADLNS